MHGPALATLPYVSQIIRRLVNLVLPVECAICQSVLTDDPVPFFCRPCWDHVKPLVGPWCPRCGHPFASPVTLAYAPRHVCIACRLHPPAYTRAWALFSYEPPLQDAIRLFKYHGKVVLANCLGDLLEKSIGVLPPVDLLMPVPLHSDRLRSRGFNQSLLLADRFNRRLQLPMIYDNLIRLRPTQPQTELSRKARLTNLRRAFALLRPEQVQRRRVLLIDDVLTTGTTVNECAKVLRKAGAADVYVLALARTV